jgi:hypothetical protein
VTDAYRGVPVNLYVFPFGVEMMLAPFVVLVVLVEAAALDPAHAPAQRFSGGVITTIGFGLLAYVLVNVLSDLSGFLTRKNAEDFLLTPALTLASFPVLFVVGVLWDTGACSGAGKPVSTLPRRAKPGSATARKLEPVTARATKSTRRRWRAGTLTRP